MNAAALSEGVPVHIVRAQPREVASKLVELGLPNTKNNRSLAIIALVDWRTLPRKPPEEKKVSAYGIRCKVSEKKKFDAEIARSGEDQTAWILEAMRQRLERDRAARNAKNSCKNNGTG